MKMLSKYFAVVEAGCRDGTPLPADLYANATELALQLDVLRAAIGRPIRVNSWYRTAEHNARVGSKETSQHRLGKAADIVVAGMPPVAVRAVVKDLIKAGKMRDLGIGLYKTFLHLDTGKPRRW